ncbi:MAG: hypothetical protein A4E67_02220 [Syntrophaceae bacterium PtaB.Bin038]|nr:MAG: hypothetical protein A4E67_02220 [Syntrophaceae bacterium PtaB.Bin038]
MSADELKRDREGRPIIREKPGCNFGAVLEAAIIERLVREESNIGGLRVQVDRLENSIRTMLQSFMDQYNRLQEKVEQQFGRLQDKVSANAGMLADTLGEFGKVNGLYSQMANQRDAAQEARDMKLDLVVSYVERKIMVRKIMANVGKAIAAVIAVAGTIAGIFVAAATLLKHLTQG